MGLPQTPGQPTIQLFYLVPYVSDGTMNENQTPAPPPKRTHWQDVTLAILVGVIALGGSVFLLAALQAPVGPPAETIPLFVWNTTAAFISLVLVWRENRYGSTASILTGLLVLVSLGLIGTGTVGAIDPRGSPLGPLSYAALAIALIVASVAARREAAALPTSAAPDEPVP